MLLVLGLVTVDGQQTLRAPPSEARMRQTPGIIANWYRRLFTRKPTWESGFIILHQISPAGGRKEDGEKWLKSGSLGEESSDGRISVLHKF